MRFNPNERPSAIEVLKDPFFEELRLAGTQLGKLSQELFNFTFEEFESDRELVESLLPKKNKSKINLSTL